MNIVNNTCGSGFTTASPRFGKVILATSPSDFRKQQRLIHSTPGIQDQVCIGVLPGRPDVVMIVAEDASQSGVPETAIVLDIPEAIQPGEPRPDPKETHRSLLHVIGHLKKPLTPRMLTGSLEQNFMTVMQALMQARHPRLVHQQLQAALPHGWPKARALFDTYRTSYQAKGDLSGLCQEPTFFHPFSPHNTQQYTFSPDSKSQNYAWAHQRMTAAS